MDKSDNTSVGYFFDNLKDIKRLGKILNSWVGTPHRHRCCVKGEGVDCICFVGCILMEMGIIESFFCPDYAPDWNLHRGEELIKNGIEKQLSCVEVLNAGIPMDGDIILYKYGRVSAHAAIYYEENIYQCTRNNGVGNIPWDTKQKKRTSFRFRMVKK